MITERIIPNIDDYQIKIKKHPIPQSSNKSLPPLFNTQLYIGSKGRGKTYSLVQLLSMYENSKLSDGISEYNIRTILIAPTAYSTANSIYQTLKSLNKDDIYLEYSDELLQKILDNIKQKKEEYQEYLEYKIAYDKFIKMKDLTKLKDEELSLLEQYEYESPQLIFGDKKPDVNFLIFDDLIGTGAFNKKAKSLLTNLTIKHRHLLTNLIFTTQSFKQIPPTIRTNIDVYAIFKSSSYAEILDKIYEDLSGYIKYDDFKQLYEHATNDAHDALIIMNNSVMSGGKIDIRKNWDKQLEINET